MGHENEVVKTMGGKRRLPGEGITWKGERNEKIQHALYR